MRKVNNKNLSWQEGEREDPIRFWRNWLACALIWRRLEWGRMDIKESAILVLLDPFVPYFTNPLRASKPFEDEPRPTVRYANHLHPYRISTQPTTSETSNASNICTKCRHRQSMPGKKEHLAFRLEPLFDSNQHLHCGLLFVLVAVSANYRLCMQSSGGQTVLRRSSRLTKSTQSQMPPLIGYADCLIAAAGWSDKSASCYAT